MGPATLFCSFSTVETKWIHVFKMLGKLVDTKDFRNKRLENIIWKDHCRLFSFIISSLNKPFYTFLAGKGGVGKSLVKKVLCQAVIKYLNIRGRDDLNKVRAIVLALTGKVAYNVQGKPIHSTFNTPASQTLKDL